MKPNWFAVAALAVVVAGCSGGGTGGSGGGGNGTGGGSGGGASGTGGGSSGTGGGSSGTGGGASGTGGGTSGTGGGASGTGGGASGTGGGTGGTGGGAAGGGAGGGGASGSGVFSIIDSNFKDPAILAAADGSFHLAYSSGFSPAVIVYARCTQSCAVASNWSRVIIESGSPSTDYTRMVMGSDGRLHVVFELFSSAVGYETIYATCAANCLNAASWAKTNLASVFGSLHAFWRGAPMVIDSSNRLSLVVSNGNTWLATCAGSCNTVANWTVGKIRDTGNRAAMVARGTTLHQVMHDGVVSLVYRSCASNCTQASSWTESVPLFNHDGNMPTAISVSAQGRVTIAYNQGTADTGQPPAVQAQNKKVIVWECSANCGALAGWAGVILGEVDNGQDGLQLLEVPGGRALTLTETGKVLLRACQVADCLQPASWASATLDTTAAISADFDPYSVTGCGAPPQFAGWYPKSAVLAVNPAGAAAFAFYTTMLRRCQGSTTISFLPGFGRVGYIPP